MVGPVLRVLRLLQASHQAAPDRGAHRLEAILLGKARPLRRVHKRRRSVQRPFLAALGILKRPQIGGIPGKVTGAHSFLLPIDIHRV